MLSSPPPSHLSLSQLLPSALYETAVEEVFSKEFSRTGECWAAVIMFVVCGVVSPAYRLRASSFFPTGGWMSEVRQRVLELYGISLLEQERGWEAASVFMSCVPPCRHRALDAYKVCLFFFFCPCGHPRWRPLRPQTLGGLSPQYLCLGMVRAILGVGAALPPLQSVGSLDHVLHLVSVLDMDAAQVREIGCQMVCHC